MHIAEIDRWCDLFEQRLKEGAALTAEQFLEEQSLPPDEDLLVELRRLEYEMRAPSALTASTVLAAPENDSAAPFIETARGRDAAGQDDGETVALPSGKPVRRFGDYELLCELGRGGMGVVYKARQISLNRPVALKMLRAGTLSSDDDVHRLQNEAEAVAQLEHPGIVPIFEVGECEGHHYYGMQFINGSSLADRIDTLRGKYREIARLVADTAEAVDHAHRRGILHRDLKPANILVDEKGAPHVTDFGLAKHIASDSELTQTGAVLGTPAYMAPEQAIGRRAGVTTASDVYGLGAVLYTLLTGRPPFRGSSVMETLDQVRMQNPKRPRSVDPSVPRDLEVICLKCLDKVPALRFQTAALVAEELHRFLRNEPILARPVGTWERSRRWVQRNPVIALLLSIVVTTVLAALVTTTTLWRRAVAANERAQVSGAIALTSPSLVHARALPGAYARTKERMEFGWRIYVPDAGRHRLSIAVGFDPKMDFPDGSDLGLPPIDLAPDSRGSGSFFPEVSRLEGGREILFTLSLFKREKGWSIQLAGIGSPLPRRIADELELEPSDDDETLSFMSVQQYAKESIASDSHGRVPLARVVVGERPRKPIKTAEELFAPPLNGKGILMVWIESVDE